MSDKEPAQGKKKFKMPNTYVILCSGSFAYRGAELVRSRRRVRAERQRRCHLGTYHIVESNPQGIWDVFMAPITGMLGSGAISGAIAISLTILLFGSFLEMMEKPVR